MLSYAGIYFLYDSNGKKYILKSNTVFGIFDLSKYNNNFPLLIWKHRKRKYNGKTI
jgi:hypothetical protein